MKWAMQKLPETANPIGQLSSVLKLILKKEDFVSMPMVQLNSWNHLMSSRPDQMLTRLIFVRHGESESNKNQRIAGRAEDSPLTDLGKQQALYAGSLLRQAKLPIKAVYSSPMQRTQHTAQLMFPDLEPRIDERLHEKFYGPYEGQSLANYEPIMVKEKQTLPRLMSFQEKFSYKPHPDFESMEEVYERVSPFIMEMHEENMGGNILIASHGGLLKSLFLYDAAQKGFEIHYRALFVNNTAAFVVEVSGDGDKSHKVNLVATTLVDFN